MVEKYIENLSIKCISMMSPGIESFLMKLSRLRFFFSRSMSSRLISWDSGTLRLSLEAVLMLRLSLEVFTLRLSLEVVTLRLFVEALELRTSLNEPGFLPVNVLPA
jgi:hypothetical protein